MVVVIVTRGTGAGERVVHESAATVHGAALDGADPVDGLWTTTRRSLSRGGG
jgi:hypothetical protein